MKTLILTTSATLFFASQAAADIGVRFLEGAPKDRFVITNLGDCAIAASQVSIDLNGSASGIIFDVTGSGAGVEVFQPLEIVAGRELLSGLPTIADGDKEVAFDLLTLGANQSIAFTIDVDDTAGTREITVAGAEIAGASVIVKTGDTVFTSTFDDTAQAVVTLPDCTS